ncbi:MAG TPA: hypothetical protein VF898_05350 [Chloroflexota bacterium]
MNRYNSKIELEIEEEARKDMVHRVAEGKAHLPAERRNEQAEKRVVEEIMERVHNGTHFASSLHPE